MTVKQTGGTWDPAARPVYFVAIAAWYLDNTTLRWADYILRATNDVINERQEIRRSAAPGPGQDRPARLGIFWLTNHHKRAHGMTMDQALTLAPEDIDGFAELEALCGAGPAVRRPAVGLHRT